MPPLKWCSTHLEFWRLPPQCSISPFVGQRQRRQLEEHPGDLQRQPGVPEHRHPQAPGLSRRTAPRAEDGTGDNQRRRAGGAGHHRHGVV